MNNIASILLLVFLAITFLQSSQDKLFHWKENVDWLKEHFAETPLRNQVSLALLNVLILELISGILCTVGAIELAVKALKAAVERDIGLGGKGFTVAVIDKSGYRELTPSEIKKYAQ